MDNQSYDVVLFGKTYTVVASKEEAAVLDKTASFLNARLQKIAQMSSTNNPEKLYIITALNIAYDLLSITTEDTHTLHDIRDKILTIHDELNQALK